MINKFFKNIHNKYSTLFKFIFFLRYLFVIFFTSAALFLIIPKFFNYEKKAYFLKDYLLKNYALKINKYEDINFSILPAPKIEIKNVESKFNEISPEFLSASIILYPKLLSIYNYDNFKTKKIILKKSMITLETSEFYTFVEKTLKQKKNFSFKNLNLKLLNKKIFLINLKNINFMNYGYKKNIFTGEIFNNKFKSEFNPDLNNIKIKISDIGYQSEINFKRTKKDSFKGDSKIKILNTNFKFDFLYSKGKFEIFNSYFRSKHLSFNNRSIITLNPYFDSKSNIIIEDFNSKILKKINFEKLLSFKEIIKKINSRNEISFKSKKFSRIRVDEFSSKIDIAYGRLNFRKNFIIGKNGFECTGLINLFEELPLLDFDCKVSVEDKKKFLKIFQINYNNKDEVFDLNVNGNISILSNKIVFKNIKTNKYKASREDLKYFKDVFENVLYNKSFLDIFDIKKIRNFILEIS